MRVASRRAKECRVVLVVLASGIPEVPTTEAPDEPRRPITVVLVDDDEMIRELFEQLLVPDSRIQVVGTAATAYEALEVVARQQPDVVVIDYVLPDMSGAAATALIKTECPDCKVITVSGLGAPSAYQAAAEGGSSAWVRKTDAATELRQTIHRVHTGGDEPEPQTIGPQLKELVVHYQTVNDLQTSAVVGFEALVRWGHPSGQLLMPDEFMASATGKGLVGHIDRRVTEVAALQLSEWQVRHKSVPARWMSVNLSPLDMRRPDLPEWVAGAIETARIQPWCFVLEVGQGILDEDPDQTAARLERLKAVGVKIALDDFGGDVSLLPALRRFPIDILKLGVSVTAGVPEVPECVRMAEATREAVAKFGLHAIAVGVERTNQVAPLLDMGWRLGQGFLFSKPQVAAACEELLVSSL